jgi:hypothetical protein
MRLRFISFFLSSNALLPILVAFFKQAQPEIKQAWDARISEPNQDTRQRLNKTVVATPHIVVRLSYNP